MLQTLELIHIRSYENGLFEFKSGVNIIVGANASGKTNLLEAIHMVCKGSGFKSDDEDMVQHRSEWARINALLDDHRRTIKITTAPLKKTYVIDDIERHRLTGTVVLPIVLFEPSHMLLLTGEPEKRRAYIDTILESTNPLYRDILKKYRRVLAQRNKLLKQDHLLSEHLFVWDVRLCELAERIVSIRKEFIEFLEGVLTDNYRRVSGGADSLSAVYSSKLSLAKDYTQAMLLQLKEHFTLDRARGFTGVGPHRDDIQFLLNGSAVKENASRGETRSIVLSLKLAELTIIEERLGKRPLLLLDDVFSELDGKRRRTLAETLQEYQTFITTTDADVVVEHFSESCNIIPL